jgi:hypothetical protein
MTPIGSGVVPPLNTNDEWGTSRPTQSRVLAFASGGTPLTPGGAAKDQNHVLPTPTRKAP